MTGTTASRARAALLLGMAFAACDPRDVPADPGDAGPPAPPPETVSAFGDQAPPPETEPALSDPPEARAALDAPEPALDPEEEARLEEERKRAAFEAAYPLHGVTFHFLARVREAPRASSKVVGYLRRGALFRASDRVPGVGCARGWHEVPGEGFVCRGEGFLVGRDPQTFSPAPAAPDTTSPLPYAYAWAPSDGIPQFWRVPTPAEEAEIDALLSARFTPDPEPEPATATETVLELETETETETASETETETETETGTGTETETATETETETDTATAADADPSPLAEPPVDVEAPPPPGAAGVADDTGADDPARVTVDAADAADAAEDADDAEPELPSILRMPMRRGFTASLDGEVTADGRRFYRTVRGGYVRANRLFQRTPSDHRGVALGATWDLPLGFVWRGGTRRLRRRGGRFLNAGRLGRLTLVEIAEQILVAYEGDRPVYATSVSTGREGFETPTGTFRVQSKHVSTTMDDLQSDDPYQIEDVPWTLYFEGNYALHGAFWHDGFGRVRSHGCVNLAPADARWLFHWAGPELPPGWHGVFASRGRPGTVVHVTE